MPKKAPKLPPMTANPISTHSGIRHQFFTAFSLSSPKAKKVIMLISKNKYTVMLIVQNVFQDFFQYAVL